VLILKAEREEKRACPVCNTPMKKWMTQNVITDRCDSCHGVWLDGGELDLLEAVLRQKGAEDTTRAFLLGVLVG